MSSVELLRIREAACWNTFLLTGQSEDLQVWRKALQALHDELQHRAVILQTSAPRPPAR